MSRGCVGSNSAHEHLRNESDAVAKREASPGPRLTSAAEKCTALRFFDSKYLSSSCPSRVEIVRWLRFVSFVTWVQYGLTRRGEIERRKKSESSMKRARSMFHVFCVQVFLFLCRLPADVQRALCQGALLTDTGSGAGTMAAGIEPRPFQLPPLGHSCPSRLLCRCRRPHFRAVSPINVD